MIRIGIMLPRLGRYGGVEQFGFRMANIWPTSGPEFR